MGTLHLPRKHPQPGAARVAQTRYKPVCPYCKNTASLVGGQVIYPRRPDLASKKFWQCAPCDAYVGCHADGAWLYTAEGKVVSDGTLPLGRLADAELRAAKQRAHAAFDPLWKEEGIPRKAAYAWLAKKMGVPVEQCHIGEFDVQQCAAVERYCYERTA